MAVLQFWLDTFRIYRSKKENEIDNHERYYNNNNNNGDGDDDDDVEKKTSIAIKAINAARYHYLSNIVAVDRLSINWSNIRYNNYEANGAWLVLCCGDWGPKRRKTCCLDFIYLPFFSRCFSFFFSHFLCLSQSFVHLKWREKKNLRSLQSEQNSGNWTKVFQCRCIIV